MNNTIDFHYNPLFKEGAEFVLKNVRNVYPKEVSNIFVWIDDDYIIKDELILIAEKYNAIPLISKNKFTWCNGNNPNESKPRLLEFFRRMYHSASLSTATWLMYLEDDVLVRNKILNFPRGNAGVNPGIVASGGSMHLTNTLRELFPKYSVEDFYKIMEKHPYHFAADRVLLKLYLDHAYEFSIFEDLADGIPPDMTDKPVLHNIKTHYPSYWREYREYLNGQTDINPMEPLI